MTTRDKRIDWPAPQEDPLQEPAEPWARKAHERDERDGWPGWRKLLRRMRWRR